MSKPYSRSSTRLMYDKCASKDYVRKSVGPGKHILDPAKNYNKNKVMHGVGVVGGYGVSHPELDSVAPKQALVDIDSFLSNRNIPASKCPKNGANLNVPDYSKFEDAKVDYMMTPVNSLLVIPKADNREVSIDRFHTLHRDPQEHVFYDFSRNTTLEAKDNFKPEYDEPMDQSIYQPSGGKLNYNRGCYVDRASVSEKQ